VVSIFNYNFLNCLPEHLLKFLYLSFVFGAEVETINETDEETAEVCDIAD